MASPALSRGLRKATRTLVQLAVGGTLTAAVSVLAGGLSPNAQVLVMTGWTVLVALLQNTLETKGTIPAMLPSPGLVTTTAGGMVGEVVGTVDTVAGAALEPVDEVAGVAEPVTDVVGEVISVTGKTVGRVTGTVGRLGRGG